MSGFCPMLVIFDVSPRAPSVDHSAPTGHLGHLGRWVTCRYVLPLDNRGASPALWLLALAFPQE
jgi:hypothetical protein